MKTLLLILISVLALNNYAQNVNIPDANFKANLVGNTFINTNADAEIQESEAAAFGGGIYCVGHSISDLTGIEAFTALTELFCGYNQLASLDVTQNTALIRLVFHMNQLTSIDVTQNTALNLLNCSNNQLTSLDVTQNTALRGLFAKNNQLTCLNVKNGSNTLFFDFDVTDNNPSLTCIEVDDVGWSNTNWTVAGNNIDAQMSFSTSCANPCTLGINKLSNTPKQLLKIVDLTGRETKFKPNTPLIYIYSDGTTERVFKMEE